MPISCKPHYFVRDGVRITSTFVRDLRPFRVPWAPAKQSSGGGGLAQQEGDNPDYFLSKAESIVATWEISGQRPLLKTSDAAALIVLIAEALEAEFLRGRGT